MKQQINRISVWLAGLARGALATAAAPFEASSPDIPSGKPADAKFIYRGHGCTGTTAR